MKSAWRKRCPQGHVTLRHRTGGGYWCQSCDRRYESEPIDAKKVDRFPVEEPA